MLTPKSAAILGSSPIITNSVVPMARPPSASGRRRGSGAPQQCAPGRAAPTRRAGHRALAGARRTRRGRQSDGRDTGIPPASANAGGVPGAAGAGRIFWGLARTTDADHELMALRHATLPLYGVQFHPEALLTTHGLAWLRNWMRCSPARVRVRRRRPGAGVAAAARPVWRTQQLARRGGRVFAALPGYHSGAARARYAPAASLGAGLAGLCGKLCG
nr:hypothetical protein [Tanacetum cinerariifolium]